MIFRYYFPGLVESDITPEQLASHELTRTFRDCADRLVIAPVKMGPDSNSAGGVIVTAPQESDQVTTHTGFYPADHESGKDSWVWIPTPNPESAADNSESGETAEHGYWLGFETENQPLPRTLRRPKVLEGYERTMGDGQDWMCPVVRQMDENKLPRSFFQLSSASPLMSRTLPEYQQAANVGALLFEWQLQAECWEPCERWMANNIDVQSGFSLAVALLSASYRVGFAECSVLQVFNNDTIGEVLRCAVDDEWRIEVLSDPAKKNAALSLRTVLVASLPGNEESEITDPQSPTTN